MRYLKTVMIALCSLAPAGAWAQTGLDPAGVCSPILTKAATERYLESNQLFRKKILSQLCSDEQMTAEKARSQGLDLNVVIEGVPLGAMWSDDQNERTSARNKLCKMDFSDVRNESHIRLLERVPVPHLVAEYNHCVELVLTSSAEMTCSLTAGDPQLSTLHITYHPKTTAPHPTALNTSVQGGYVIGGAADAEYTKTLEMWRKTRGTLNVRAPVPPSSDIVFPNGTEIKVGSTFVNLVRNDGKPLTVNVGNSRGIPCSAELAPTDEVKLDVLLVPHGKNTVIRNSVKQLRAEDGCSADGSVLHEKQYCTDDEATLENFEHHVVSAGSPRDASYIENIERKGNCVTAYYRLKGAGLDVTRSCKGSAWLGVAVVLNQKVPVGDLIAFPSQQTTMTNSRMNPGCSSTFVFGQKLPQGAVVQDWTWKANIEALEPEFDANGVRSVKKKYLSTEPCKPSEWKVFRQLATIRWTACCAGRHSPGRPVWEYNSRIAGKRFVRLSFAPSNENQFAHQHGQPRSAALQS